MYSSQLNTFEKTVQKRTTFTSIKNNLNHNIGKWKESLPNGQRQFQDLSATKSLANARKRYAMENLPELLFTFEANSTRNGAKVLWAKNDKDAIQYILQICAEKKCRTVVKSKSMATEEIHLNQHLEEKGIHIFETDLGEFIQQLSGEPPIHILTPAMHRNKEEVADLFYKKLQTHPNLPPEELTKVARKYLREQFLAAEIGITGANFILPDIGGVAITENEGNARLCIGLPKTHIVLVGIEKMIPSTQDLSLFWPLLATYGTGQYITAYSSIITGPKQPDENDGPEEMYVILMDNGRTNLYKDQALRESLYCIRCGSCLNVCPIYTNVAGGHAYGTTYTGPIGSVITPHLKGMHQWGHLSFASTLCGACTEICPVQIPLHELLQKNRNMMIAQHHTTLSESILWGFWSFLMKRPFFYKKIPYWLKKISTTQMKKWNKYRSPLPFVFRPFHHLWKKYRS